RRPARLGGAAPDRAPGPLTSAGGSRRREAHSLPMGPPRQAKKKRRFRPAPPPPPRWRLPVRRPPFWAGIAVGLAVSAALRVAVQDRLYTRPVLRRLGRPPQRELHRPLLRRRRPDAPGVCRRPAREWRPGGDPAQASRGNRARLRDAAGPSEADPVLVQLPL